MKRQHRDFLIIETIGREFASFPVKNEGICSIPVLDHVEPFMNFPTEFLRLQILTEKNGLNRSPKLSKSLIGWVLQIVACKPSQDRLGLGCPLFERCRIFDHLVILI